jgi:acyl-CoA thioesterase
MLRKFKKLGDIVKQDIVNIIKGDSFANKLGITLTQCEEGYAETMVEIDQSMTNFHGPAHGGLIFTLADYAFAAASNSYGQVAVGLNVHMSYLAPGLVGHTLRCIATEINRTPRIAVYRMTVKNDLDKTIASMEGTVYRKKDYFGGVEDGK